MSPLVGRKTISESLKTILICVDSYDEACMKGLVYHGSFDEAQKFQSVMQLLLIIEQILDITEYPKPTVEKRRFHSFKDSNEDIVQVNKEFDFKNLKGNLATFKVKIMFRQHASWQGSVSWIENNNTEPFRSALELLMLMNSAMTE